MQRLRPGQHHRRPLSASSRRSATRRSARPTRRAGWASSPSTGGETRWMDVPGRPPRPLHRPDGLGRRLGRAGPPAPQPAPEHRRGDARRRRDRARSGRSSTERDEAWVDVVDDLHWLDDGRRFTWISERDGWRHLYLARRDGGRAAADHARAVRRDRRRPGRRPAGEVDFIASPDDPKARYLYRVPLDGSATPRRLTPADQPGTHAYQVSPDGRWAFHTYSTFDAAAGRSSW